MVLLIFCCRFHEAMKHFTLTQLTNSSTLTLPTTPAAAATSMSQSLLTPPHSILPYQPLVLLINALIISLNELRSCAPVAIGPEVSREIERLLQSTVHDIQEYYRYQR